MTNIIYLTTDCNLDCDYCYEAIKRHAPDFEHFKVTEQAIDEYIEELELREGKVPSSTIVIMGGEPTLAQQEFEYLIDKVVASAKKMKKEYHGLYTTNAILLNNPKFYKSFMDNIAKADKHGFDIKVEISYDGVGHTLRKFPNGKSSKEIVENVLQKLTDDKHLFCISYTVHEGNYLNLCEDAIRIMEKYPSLDRLSFSVAYQRLDDELDVESGIGLRLIKEYAPLMKQIFAVYKKPICPLVCGDCRICSKGNYVGNRYLSPTKGILTAEKTTSKLFDQF